MNFSSVELTSLLGIYFWPFVRIAAMIMAVPILGTRMIPARIKIMIALGLTVAVAPLIPKAPAVEILSLNGFMLILVQMLIGVAMGFILNLVFAAFVLCGQIIGMTMGLGFASMNDPITGVVVPTVGQFYTIFVTLAFFSLNGHHILFEVMADSFVGLPVGFEMLSMDAVWAIVSWASKMFGGAMLVALPAVASMLVVNLGFGIMTRAAPQLNIFAVGFPVIMSIGFVVILMSLPSVIPQFERLLAEAYTLMRNSVGAGI